MKLGIIQKDPSDPNSLKIVNQETGEELENVMSYSISRNSCNSCQVIYIEVIADSFKQKIIPIDERLNSFFEKNRPC